MSLNRIKLLLRCIRFDNGHTREQRKIHDKLLLFQKYGKFFFETSLHSWKMYYRGQTACWITRENSRANVHSVQTKKIWFEDILGLRVQHWVWIQRHCIWWKRWWKVHHNLAQDIVLKVVKPWYGTGRNICTDNYFTSYTLANQLLQQNLTLLGTVRRHHRKVPLVWRQKNKLYRSKFIFNHGDGICLVTYQAKQNEKPVMLLSSSHSDPSVDSGESKKSRMILDYNASKGGVDPFNQNLKEFFAVGKLSVGLSYSFLIY